jgi:hypothetical protein
MPMAPLKSDIHGPHILPLLSGICPAIFRFLSGAHPLFKQRNPETGMWLAYSDFTGPDSGVTRTYFRMYDFNAWDTGLVYQIDGPDGSITAKTWVANTLPASLGNHNAYVSSETYTPFGGSASSKIFVQDRNGNITSSLASDWGGSPNLRSTTTTYYLGTSGTPSNSDADGYWNPGIGCSGQACILNLPKSTVNTDYMGSATRQEFCYDGVGNLTLEARLKQGIHKEHSRRIYSSL